MILKLTSTTNFDPLTNKFCTSYILSFYFLWLKISKGGRQYIEQNLISVSTFTSFYLRSNDLFGMRRDLPNGLTNIICLLSFNRTLINVFMFSISFWVNFTCIIWHESAWNFEKDYQSCLEAWNRQLRVNSCSHPWECNS